MKDAGLVVVTVVVTVAVVVYLADKYDWIKKRPATIPDSVPEATAYAAAPASRSINVPPEGLRRNEVSNGLTYHTGAPGFV